MNASVTRWLRCTRCEARHGIAPLFEGCPRCARDGEVGRLEMQYDVAAMRDVTLASLAGDARSIWTARALLPLDDPQFAVTLGEGHTPLVPAPRLAREVGCAELLLKNETVNPTWSHKDRYNAVAISMARALGVSRILTYTTGNHGNSMAAYAAIAGLESAVFLHPQSSDVHRALASLYGSRIVVGDLAVVRETMGRMIRDGGWVPSASFSATLDGVTRHFVNPFAIEGYKTVAYELAAALADAPPDAVLAPVGYGDLLGGTWRGYTDLLELGLIREVPRMIGCQTDAAAPLALAVKAGHVVTVEERDGLPLSIIEGRCSELSLRAVRESQGAAGSVSDAEVEDAMRLLGRSGICAEPASAVPVAVLRRLLDDGTLPRGARVVCVITSAGVKWPRELARVSGAVPVVTSPDDPALAALARA